jgi:hypothetical protein
VRIWHPIPPICLDDKALLGEHRELHCIWTVLTEGKTGYSRHPETRRWAGREKRLCDRHELLVAEMHRRGWKHHSPLDPGVVTEHADWPEPIEPVTQMRALLAAKIKTRRG